MGAQRCDYVLPDAVDVPAVGAALPAGLVLAVERATTEDRTYYDTFDGRLHVRALTLALTGEQLVLGDGGSDVAVVTIAGRPERLLATDVPDGPVHDVLAPIVEMRALCPVARVRARLSPARVLDDDAKTVVRLAVEDAASVADGAAPRALPRRLRVLPVRGYDKDLRRVCRALEESLDLRVAADSVADAAVIAAGGAPGGVSSKLEVELRPQERADRAATILLTQLVRIVEQNLPGTLADVDSEFLHDLRVAVRRTRSVQRQLARVFPPAPLDRFRAEFRWLQQVTGPVRDLDVQLLELDDLARPLPDAVRDDLEPLRGVLLRHRRQERARMVRALRARRTAALLEDWSAFLDDLVAAPEADRPDAARPIADVAGRRIAKVYRRMADAGSAVDDATPPEALHELRKTGKELRYLLELFGGLYPAKVVKPMIKTLKALQDTLGRHQDREVQVAALRSLSPEVAAVPGGAEALLAVGALVVHLQGEQRAARAEFAERFAAFASTRQRARVKRTFR